MHIHAQVRLGRLRPNAQWPGMEGVEAFHPLSSPTHLAAQLPSVAELPASEHADAHADAGADAHTDAHAGAELLASEQLSLLAEGAGDAGDATGAEVQKREIELAQLADRAGYETQGEAGAHPPTADEIGMERGSRHIHIHAAEGPTPTADEIGMERGSRYVRAVQSAIQRLGSFARGVAADGPKQRRWVVAPLCSLLFLLEVQAVRWTSPELPQHVWVILVATRYFSWRAVFNSLNYLRPIGLKATDYPRLVQLEAAFTRVAIHTVAAHHLITDLTLGLTLQLPVLLLSPLPFISAAHRFFILRVTARGLSTAVADYQSRASSAISSVSATVASAVQSFLSGREDSFNSFRRTRT